MKIPLFRTENAADALKYVRLGNYSFECQKRAQDAQKRIF
jgi:hypothetical protein